MYKLTLIFILGQDRLSIENDWLSFCQFQVSVHLVLSKQDCKCIAQAEVSMNEVLDYPSNKLHGSVMLKMMPKENSEVATEKVIGSLDYWFKLHTAGNVKMKTLKLW